MCGAALTASAPREERKVVSVLFTDLVGFTGRAEQLDPEDVRATLTPYYAQLREQIEHRGGTVEKFIGDAVMAVFGAPLAEASERAAMLNAWVSEVGAAPYLRRCEALLSASA
jgi:class 3 adenylate cyclase